MLGVIEGMQRSMLLVQELPVCRIRSVDANDHCIEDPQLGQSLCVGRSGMFTSSSTEQTSGVLTLLTMGTWRNIIPFLWRVRS